MSAATVEVTQAGEAPDVSGALHVCGALLVGARLTADGGARQLEADLWCSYAATRTLHWLGARPDDANAVADYLRGRQNLDGGFAWQRGLPSDVWASYYCAQTLRDLGEPVPTPSRLAAWLSATRTSDGGFAMTPGQSADVWATYYASRLYAEVLDQPVPDCDALAGWLAGLQGPSGGLGWSPGSRQVDVRAGYYGALAWQAAGTGRPSPWDTGSLVRWLQDRQGSDGGFAFGSGTPACAWAAFRATHALRALGAGPRDVDGLLAWLDARRLPSGGYERWPSYGVADVWACFSVVGARLAVDRPLPAADVSATVDAVRACQLPDTGFTYRQPDAAGDSLATAAALLVGAEPERIAGLQAWLRAAQTPYEGGVMYMPGRGAEVRCTLWAAAALNRTGSGLDSSRLGWWLRGLQNVDGGVGYWIGRGSDLVSTAAAVELAQTAGIPVDVLDRGGVLRFLDRCRTQDGYAPVPGARTTLAATAQALRVRHALGVATDPDQAIDLLTRWSSSLGGYAATPRAVPDLLSTYQAALTVEQFGRTWDRRLVGRLLRRLAVDGGYAWSPLSRRPGGALAGALGRLLAKAVAGDPVPLPRLSL